MFKIIDNVEEEKFESLFGIMKDSIIITGDIIGSAGEKWNADKNTSVINNPR